MLTQNLNPETRKFLELNLPEDDSLELPPHFQGLRAKPNVPARVPHKSVSEEIREFMKCSVCLPTGENEAEGG
ncbi:MAG: hypothetical protein GF387_02060 [Candidatus Portnoybacteria bacterium]|nr:hypothetical protein [Candidatus Portnoybacteria bacterium]